MLRPEADRIQIKQLTKDLSPIYEFRVYELQRYEGNDSFRKVGIISKGLSDKQAEQLMNLIKESNKEIEGDEVKLTYNQEFCRLMINFYEKKLEEWRKTPNIPVCEMWIEKGEKKLAWFKARKDLP